MLVPWWTLAIAIAIGIYLGSDDGQDDDGSKWRAVLQRKDGEG